MDVALAVARMGLALVFAFAAAGKIADRRGTGKALTDFGLRERQAALGAVLLPAGELATAVLLFASPTARWGGIAAALLMAAFIAAIARVLRQGRTPDCHCFGQIRSAPVSARTLIRNGALMAVAVFLASAGPGRAIDSQLSALSATAVALLATSLLCLVLAAAALWLWLQNRSLETQLRGTGVSRGLPATLPVGSPAPDFALVDENDQPATLRGLLAKSRPLVLVFTSHQCAPCRALMPELARWQRVLAHQLSIIPISSGDPADSRALAAEHDLSPMLIAPDPGVSEAYAVPATPAAIALAADGRVASLPATGAPAVEALIRVTLHRPPDHQPATSPTTLPG